MSSFYLFIYLFQSPRRGEKFKSRWVWTAMSIFRKNTIDERIFIYLVHKSSNSVHIEKIQTQLKN